MSKRLPSHIVYENIYKLFTYRGVKPNSPQMTLSEFKTRMTNNYVIVTGVDADDNFVLVCIANESEYVAESKYFEKLLKLLLDQVKTAKADSANIIIVTPGPISNFLKKKLVVYEKANPNHCFEHHEYIMFLCEKPLHVSTAKYELLTEEDMDDIRRTHKDVTNFPKIYVTDPGAVWIGARVGNILKIKKYSESAGWSIGYEQVVRPDTSKDEDYEEDKE